MRASQLKALHKERERQKDEEGHACDDGEQVDLIEPLLRLASHQLLAQHVTRLEGDVGPHGGKEADPVEGHLSQAHRNSVFERCVGEYIWDNNVICD